MSKRRRELEFDEVQLGNLADYSASGRSLIEVLAEDFYMQGQALLEQIRRAAENDEIEYMRDFAHALKSLAATLGLIALAKACGELEENSFSQPDIQVQLKRLEKYFDNACAWLKARQRATQAS